MESLQTLWEANRRYVSEHPSFPDSSVPSLGVVLVTCMDVRIDPLALFGLHLGEVHVIRNAGARVTDDVIRSLVISQQALATDTVILIPHTDCGVLGLQPEDLCSTAVGSLPPLDFRPMNDLETALREDLGRLRETPWIPDSVRLIGAVYDVRTGLVRVVEPNG